MPKSLLSIVLDLIQFKAAANVPHSSHRPTAADGSDYRFFQGETMFSNRRQTKLLLIAAIVFVCGVSTGCIGGLAQVIYMIKGHDVPAEYAGLNEKRVAVVVIADHPSHGPDPLRKTIARSIASKLEMNIEEIDVVPEIEIAQWIDENNWSGADFAEVGSGVEADLVLGIYLDDYSIRQGSTIYKGHSEVTVTVVDCATGKTTYTTDPEIFEYPENGRPALQTDDRKFEVFYLAWLTKRIARQFYKYNPLEDVADDAAFAG